MKMHHCGTCAQSSTTSPEAKKMKTASAVTTAAVQTLSQFCHYVAAVAEVRRLKEEAARALAKGGTTTVTTTSTPTSAVKSTDRTLELAKSDAITGLGKSACEADEVEVQRTDGTKCYVCHVRSQSMFKEALMVVYLQLKIEGVECRVVHGDTFDVGDRFVAIFGT